MGPFTRELLAEMISSIQNRLSKIEKRLDNLDLGGDSSTPKTCSARIVLTSMCGGDTKECNLSFAHIGPHEGNGLQWRWI